MTARRLVLLRHGRTASNAEGRMQGQSDVPLDEVGHAQAKGAAAALAELLAQDAARGAVRIVASDLSRALETARPLAERLGLAVATDPELRERFFGSWEGLRREEIEARDPEDFRRWTTGVDVAAGGGETQLGCARRAEAAVRHHAAATADDDTLVVVGHGAATRGSVLGLLGLLGGDEEAASAMGRIRSFAVLGNAHWALLGRTGGAWVLHGYNLAAPDAASG